eukprot:GHVQ01023071.1.p1 GENE.GHVQ01023071.1~~GHVQ01023071.1.p1  ORF type:complete len:524 (+),score=57.82 GHVQ01023071.1:721-2292(+)
MLPPYKHYKHYIVNVYHRRIEGQVVFEAFNCDTSKCYYLPYTYQRFYGLVQSDATLIPASFTAYNSRPEEHSNPDTPISVSSTCAQFHTSNESSNSSGTLLVQGGKEPELSNATEPASTSQNQAENTVVESSTDDNRVSDNVATDDCLDDADISVSQIVKTEQMCEAGIRLKTHCHEFGSTLGSTGGDKSDRPDKEWWETEEARETYATVVSRLDVYMSSKDNLPILVLLPEKRDFPLVEDNVNNELVKISLEPILTHDSLPLGRMSWDQRQNLRAKIIEIDNKREMNIAAKGEARRLKFLEQYHEQSRRKAEREEEFLEEIARERAQRHARTQRETEERRRKQNTLEEVARRRELRIAEMEANRVDAALRYPQGILLQHNQLQRKRLLQLKTAQRTRQELLTERRLLRETAIARQHRLDNLRDTNSKQRLVARHRRAEAYLISRRRATEKIQRRRNVINEIKAEKAHEQLKYTKKWAEVRMTAALREDDEHLCLFGPMRIRGKPRRSEPRSTRTRPKWRSFL